MGSFTKEFEREDRSLFRVKRSVCRSDKHGTSALHIGLLAANLNPGDEVITPSFNYVADHQAISAASGKVVMCDIKEDDFGIDCDKAEDLHR